MKRRDLVIWELHLNQIHWLALSNPNQGMLSATGIAGYKWVAARIGRFFQNKIFFSYYQRPVKNRKNWFSFVSRNFSCSGSLSQPNHFSVRFLPHIFALFLLYVLVELENSNFSLKKLKISLNQILFELSQVELIPLLVQY